MSISETDTKLLWGRAAGICSNPRCRANLTLILKTGEGFNIGEMAHVIARRPNGPRGQPQGGEDTYSNLILLCPTCHRLVDKEPNGEYSEELLHAWKIEHETQVRRVGSSQHFSTVDELKREVTKLLLDNHALWSELGPRSKTAQNDPGSNLYLLWNLRKVDRIIPNNHRIINMIDSNSALLSIEELREFSKFKNHAGAFELHQYQKLDSYPTFPQSFEEAFRV